MGGSLSFTPNSESPTEPGKKSILTSDIAGVSADQLLEGIEKFVRDGKANNGAECTVEVSDKDGGILNSLTFQKGGKLFMLYKFDKASNQVEIATFPGPALFERGVATSTCTMKVHSEPVRVESWVDSHGARLSGPVLKQMLDNVLGELEATVDTTLDAPGIEDSSKLSVVSGPIEGKPVEADTFLDKYKQLRMDKSGATELPDGSLVLEMTPWGPMGPTLYSKHVVNKDDNCVYISDYAADSTMADLRATLTFKVHKAPFRLEVWRDEVAARRAGEDELKVMQPMLEGVLKEMQG